MTHAKDRVPATSARFRRDVYSVTIVCSDCGALTRTWVSEWSLGAELFYRVGTIVDGEQPRDIGPPFASVDKAGDVALWYAYALAEERGHRNALSLPSLRTDDSSRCLN